MAILITGSNGGVGSSIARYLARTTSHALVLHVHNGRQAVEAISAEFPGRTRIVSADLCDEKQVIEMVTSLEQADVRLDGLVNVVGITSNGMSWKLESAEFDRVMLGNVKPTFLCTKHVLPGMRARKHGRIVNLASVVADTGAVGASHYGAAKGAIVGFTRCVAKEVVRHGITVNALALGYMEVGLIASIPPAALEEIKAQIPVQRLGTASEIGAAASWLLSPEAAYVTGQTIRINGGMAS
jgi:3-oxoacyl-[acyl-carrier protein] reductase